MVYDNDLFGVDIITNDQELDQEIIRLQERESAESALHGLVREIQSALAENDREIDKRWLKKYELAVDRLVCLANGML